MFHNTRELFLLFMHFAHLDNFWASFLWQKETNQIFPISFITFFWMCALILFFMSCFDADIFLKKGISYLRYGITLKKKKKRHFYRSSKLYKILASKLIKYYGYKVWKCEIMNWYFKIMAVFFFSFEKENIENTKCQMRFSSDSIVFFSLKNDKQMSWIDWLCQMWSSQLMFTQFKKFQMFWTLFIKVHEWSSQFSHFIQIFIKYKKQFWGYF